MKKIFLISGESGVGKTTLVVNLNSEINKLGVKTSGIYSLARIKRGIKTGIFAIDLSSGSKKLLAIHQPGWDSENPNREWKMDPEALKWGDIVIKNSVPTTILIIDELGYLEFEKNMGWNSAFKVLDEGEYKCAIVVVRASLLEKALEKFDNAQVIAIKNPREIKENTNFLISQIVAI